MLSGRTVTALNVSVSANGGDDGTTGAALVAAVVPDSRHAVTPRTSTTPNAAASAPQDPRGPPPRPVDVNADPLGRIRITAVPRMQPPGHGSSTPGWCPPPADLGPVRAGHPGAVGPPGVSITARTRATVRGASVVARAVSEAGRPQRSFSRPAVQCRRQTARARRPGVVPGSAGSPRVDFGPAPGAPTRIEASVLYGDPTTKNLAPCCCSD